MNHDIAVIGLAVRLPGALTVADYWRNLAGGVESVEQFDDTALLEAGVPARVLREPRYVKSGVRLEGFDRFDAEFFGLSPKEAAIMDPQHRQFLECSWEALEDAGHPPSRFDGPIGVFAGCGMGSYFAMNVLRNRRLMDEVGLFLLRHTGNDKDFLATRVSYCFDLKGPSVNVQTACSTSLVAIHLASQSLLSGESDMALAGGVTIELPQGHGYHYKEGEILSPDGHCRAFDHRSRGTIFGSGAGVVVLRRLDDAIADRDHIYAVVKGSAVNNDGAGKVGYLAPSVDGQAAAIAEALAMADIDPRAVDYVECHGTGTEIGDPIEVSALKQAFAGAADRQFCGIGSVKTNIGHLDTAAGVASFAKVCLALSNGAIPPTINYERPNPLIDFAQSPFFVNDRLRPWPRGDRPRLAGVTSLGVGGTNAHVIVGEAPAPAPSSASTRPHQLLVWSARNNRSLDGYARRLSAWFDEHPDAALADVASTLAFGRHAFARRRVAACVDRDEARRVLGGDEPRRVHTHTATDGAQVVFLLPGGGAQYRHMGRDLHRTDDVFREHVDRGLQLLDGELDVDLREVWLGDAMSDDEAEQIFDRPSVQLPAIFLLEYALAKAWQARGVEPSALLGHSLGENTAACLAGVFRFEDALRLVTLRGRLFEKVEGGGMLSVPLSAAECERRLEGPLDLATVNAPELCVVSGPDRELEAFRLRLLEDDIEAQRVKIKIAAHSRLLEPILADFEAFLASIELRAPELPFVSNRTGKWITPEQATSPRYWVEHLRNTVRFAEGAELLIEDTHNVFLEVGPGRTLSSLVRLNPRWNQDRSAIPSLRHPDEVVADDAFLTAAYGRLWAAGVDVPLEAVVDADRDRLSLPTYAFRHERYWIEADDEADAGAGPEALERVDDIAQWLWQPRWKRADLAEPSAPPTGTWLLFMDGLGVLRRVAERLRGAGAEVVEIHVGDSYERIDAGRYALAPEAGREGYDALLADLTASGKSVRGVLHGWMLTADRSARPGSSFFHRCEEQGFYSLFFLAQALGAEDDGPDEGRRIVVLANELAGPDDGPTCPEKAMLIGPCGVMPRELPDVSVALVDVALPRRARGRKAMAQLDALADAVTQELGRADEGLFALRDGARFTREHARGELPAPGADLPSPVREGGTYLVTGGLGGVGSLVAEWLARSSRANLVLVSRRALPPRDEWDEALAAGHGDDATCRAIQQVRLLESFGAQVLVGSADVADPVRMRALVAAARERFGAIHGAFHAAGVLDDGLIAAKDQSGIERVLAPKVQGALVLEEVLGEEPTDFLVLFSSTSAVLGPPGQVDYVAANAFLDAMARKRTAEGRPTVAVQWGVWNRVGMSAVEDDGAAAGGRPEPVALSLFDERCQVSADEVHFRGRYDSAERWLLDEHRTAAGDALVPGTGYLEMASQCLRGLDEKRPFEVRDLYFFRPLRVDDGAGVAVRARLRRSIEGYEFQVQTEADGGVATHAQARLLLHAMDAPDALDLDAVRAACADLRRPEGRDWIPSPQEAHLRFGPRWRVVRELRYGEGQAIARVALAPEFAGDVREHALHPALLDLATGFAMELIEGYDASRLWVPLAYRAVRVFGDLPAEFHSVVRRCQALGSGDIVALDLVLCDDDGRVLVEVEGFQMKRLSAEQGFAVADDGGARKEPAGARDNSSAASQLLAENIEKGIRPEEGMEALGRVLASGLRGELMVTSLPLDGLRAAQAAAEAPAAPAGERFARPELDNDYVEPRDDLERGLVHFWEELLGIDSIGVTDDFFALGGHSLIAVRLFAKIKKAYRVDYPMSVLFEAPTIDALAGMLRRDGVSTAGETDAGAAAAQREAPRSRHRHLVAMHSGKRSDATPFFLVAGMFGNVLNLRHLAQLVGEDRPFYGLQARGLFGDMAPHETFEEAARDYLDEVRSVQPNGPYLLGGFSGGGIAAYEMARQLREAGEEVALLVLLDTPLPDVGPVGKADRVKIHRQHMREEGLGYFWRWAQNRFRWEVQRWRRRFGGAEEEAEPSTFHSQAIEQAFRRALGRYEVVPQDLATWLFRPVLDKRYDLGDGRFANTDRELVFEDNGWGRFVERLRVVETPGDHDSMVLEPNVRSLAGALREAIEGAVAGAEEPSREAPTPGRPAVTT